MKSVISVLTGISLSGAIICLFALFQTEWSFSALFKSVLFFSSAFIGLLAFRASNFNTFVLLFSVLGFSSLAMILVYVSLYPILWNSVLAGHILLIGFTLYLEMKNHQPSLLRKITTGSIIISLSLFIVLILLKIQYPLFYSILFVLLALTSILFITSKLLAFFRK